MTPSLIRCPICNIQGLGGKIGTQRHIVQKARQESWSHSVTKEGALEHFKYYLENTKQKNDVTNRIWI